jgi:hypothetical protein
MSDYLQPADLEKDKKHSTFYSEVITGKAGGLAGGANIDTATNAVTSQTQKTMPKIMGDAELSFDAQLDAQQVEHASQISAHEIEHDNQIAAHESEFISQLQAQGWNPVAGSFEAGGTIVNRRDILWWEAAKAWYSWQGVIPVGGYVVPTGSTPATAGGVSPTAWVDRTDGALRTELAWAVAEYHVSSTLTLTEILTMTTGPVTIYAPIGRWPGCDGSLWRDGITLLGAQMPHISSDGRRLENGTVFTGAIDIFKKGYGCIMNCGFDCGPDFVSGGGVSGNGLMITNTLPSEQTSPQPSIKNWLVDNVSGLCLPASDGGAHGLLFEGMEDSHVGFVVGYNGIASVVIKNKNSTCGTLVGYYGDPYTVTIKSNKYAPVENVIVDGILSFGGGGVTIVSDDPAAVGSGLKDVTIGNVIVRGGKTGFQGTSTDAQPIDGLTVGNLVVTGTSVGAGGFSDGAKNVTIGQHRINACANGIGVIGNADVNIGDGSSTGNGQFGYVISSPNARAGRIKSEFNGVNGTYITTDGFRVTAYEGSDHAEKSPVNIDLTGLKDGISISGTVISQPKYRTFSGGRASIDQGVSSLAITVGGQIAMLPSDIRPLYNQNGGITVNDGVDFKTIPVSIGTDGAILSLTSSSGVSWTLYFSGLQFSYR